MDCDSMQPSLMRLKEDPHQPGKRLYITIHVDDLFVVGDENEAKKFFKNLEEKEGWKLEKERTFQRHGQVRLPEAQDGDGGEWL